MSGGMGGGGFGTLMTVFAFGYWIYSLFNPKKSDRPDPEEIQLTNYCRNAPVPLVYGTDKVAGTCIYLGNCNAEYVEAGGKGIGMVFSLFIGGGPQQTPGWQYSADFAIGLSEGETYSVSAIYLNDINLIEVIDQFDWSFQRGTNDQVVNSAISDVLVDGTAVPWRNTSYLWMSGQLGNVNQVPTVTAEIAGLLSYNALPITALWKNISPFHNPASRFDSYDPDWCSYHVTGGTNLKHAYTWTFPKDDGYLYMVSHDQNFDNANVYKINVIENLEDYATLIFRVSETQASIIPYNDWGLEDHHNDPHNLKVKVELIKGVFPVGLTRWWNWFLWVNRNDMYTTTHQELWDIFKIDSVNEETSEIWLSYEYCNCDTNIIYKGDYLYLFDFTDFVEWKASFYTSHVHDAYGTTITTTGLQYAAAYLDLSYLVPDGLEILSDDNQVCSDIYCSEMWYTHLLRRDTVIPANSPYAGLWKVYSVDHPYFPNYTDINFTFPDSNNGKGSGKPIMAIGNNERHPTRWVLLWKNHLVYNSYSFIFQWWEFNSDNNGNGTMIYEWEILADYNLWGDYILRTSIYYSGSWIYTFFNIGFSGMPDAYGNRFYRFNPYTLVHERLREPSSIFRDQTKISKGTNGNIVGCLSRQNAIGTYGEQFVLVQWDTFPGVGPDISPIEVAYDFLTNTRYGMSIPASQIDGSPYIVSTTSTWYLENLYCYEMVDIEGAKEARFLYSGKLETRQKGFDYIREILQTCRGFLYYCDGKIKVRIEKGTEVPIIYFGNEEVTLLAYDYVIGDKDAIYLDDNRPDNYWAGDIGYVFYIDGYGSMPYGVGGYGGTNIQINHEYGLTSPLITNFIVLSSTVSCLTLLENMEYEVPEDTPIMIKKDNFRKDSFQYKMKPDTDRMNQLHFEYVRREEDYRTDVLDQQDEYNIHWTGEIRELSFSMPGIKRDAQARRMLTFLSDFNSIIAWSCNFDTDIVGMLLCIGDVVGVTNEINNWYGKLFRVITIEEMESYEHKIELLEYIPTIYHDEYIAYSPPNEYRYDGVFVPPDDIINLLVIEDKRINKIWIGFSKPITNDDWWIGAIIWHYNPNILLWEQLGISYWNTFTADIASAITVDQTSIPFSTTHYDSDKLQSSGIIWIDEEMIYYNYIDDVNHLFLNCIRGYNDTVAVVHSTGTCIYLRDSLFYYEYDMINDVGKIHQFKAVSISNYGFMSDGDTAPIVSITINGSYLLPYPVGNLYLYELE